MSPSAAAATVCGATAALCTATAAFGAPGAASAGRLGSAAASGTHHLPQNTLTSNSLDVPRSVEQGKAGGVET